MAGEDADAASRIEEKIEDDSRGRLSSTSMAYGRAYL